MVWNPHLKKHINKIEKVQRAATRWVPSLRNLSYEERLKRLNLPTLEERRRGDMIMMYKCVTGMEEIDKEEYIIPANRRSRGHSRKLQKTKRGDKDVRKYSFPTRAIDVWSQLPDEVVCAKSIHKFKEMYDKVTIEDGTI